MRALEIHQIAANKRNGESTTAATFVNKCLTKHDKDDIESLLLNEHTNQVENSASNSDKPDDSIDTNDQLSPSTSNDSAEQCDKKEDSVQSKY